MPSAPSLRPLIRVMLPCLLAGALGLLAADPAAAQAAPAGFYSCEDKDAGYFFHCPKKYKAIPLPPGERTVLGRYVQQKGTSSRDRRGRTTGVGGAEMLIIALDEPPRAVTGAEPPEEEEEAAPPVAAPPSLFSVEAFVQQRLKSWRIVEKSEQSKRRLEWTEYQLATGNDPAKVIGRAWGFDQGTWTLVFLVMAPREVFEEQERDFEKSALSLKVVEPSEAELEKMERYYRMRPEYKDPDYRMARRRELVRGWEALDTENYLILHNSKDSQLLKRIQNDLEAMRLFYEDLFPPAEPVETVSVVRVCRDRPEYLQYGGNPRSAGYWNSQMRELVLYDNVGGKEGSRLGNKDTYIVLYHEAFHQYIHYASGELPPHSWFNEGYGDYFSGAVIYSRSTKVKEVEENPWRLPVIKAAVEAGKHVPLEKLVHAEKSEYYRNASLYYAQGWAFIFFLETSRAAEKRDDWQEILPTYFNTLKASYAEELAKAGEGPSPLERQQAGMAARKKAVEVAFAQIDFDEMEEEWTKFVSRLR